MQNQAPNSGGNDAPFPQNPEILSDEQMHARAAELAQQIYEQQIAAMRAQRERQRAYNAYTQAYTAYANAYNTAAARIQNPQTPQSAGTEMPENAENFAGTPEGTEETGTPEVEDFPEESEEEISAESEEEISDESGVPAEEFPENDETESAESSEETEISGDESAEESESVPASEPKRVPAANANRALKVPSAPIETALVSLYYIASRLIVAVVILFCICLLGFLAIVLFTENPRYDGLRTSILSLFEIKKDESAPADDASAEKSVGVGIPDPARKSAENSAETAAAVPDPAPENFDYFSDDSAVPAEETPENVPAETGEKNDSAENFDDEKGEPGVIIETDDTETDSDDENFSEDDEEEDSVPEEEEEEEDSDETDDAGTVGEDENSDEDEDSETVVPEDENSDEENSDDIFGDDEEDEATGRALLF